MAMVELLHRLVFSRALLPFRPRCRRQIPYLVFYAAILQRQIFSRFSIVLTSTDSVLHIVFRLQNFVAALPQLRDE